MCVCGGAAHSESTEMEDFFPLKESLMVKASVLKAFLFIN